MTSNEALTRIDRIFNQALKWSLEDRVALLASACDDDEELRHEVESLLAAAIEMDDNFLEKPILPLNDAPEELTEDDPVGVYRVVRKIGKGGMGNVYLAARDDEIYEQQVAIKILKRDIDSEEIVHRFSDERQFLARLDHPHIVKILDGGTTADGLPYFVMEYVDGEPVDRYCDVHQLSVRARLELFREVCLAVGFAHQNLVVHRDLKPHNILINRGGEPKLLDFGIAKLLKPDRTSLTQAGQPMTPDYASPEQIRNGPVTTASDVYSLGRLLYELLTGTHPFGDIPTKSLCQQTLTREPEPPSQAAGCGHLVGDLDSIVLKALEKDPRRRYTSVEQLSEDLGRYLEGLPVQARQGTVRYRLGKFVRRHRLGVAMAAAALVGVLGFAISMVVLWNQAVRERERAENLRQEAEEVTRILVDALQDPDLEEKGDELEKAEKLAWEIRRRAAMRWGTDNPSMAKAKNYLALVLKRKASLRLAQGRAEEAEESARWALEIFRQTKPEGHWQIAEAESVLGGCLLAQGHGKEAAPLLRRGYKALRAAKGDAARQTREAFERLEELATKNR